MTLISHIPSFHWSVNSDSDVFLQRPGGPPLFVGDAVTLLNQLRDFSDDPPEPFAVRSLSDSRTVTRSGASICVAPSHDSAIRAARESRELEVLSALAAMTGLKLDPTKWRVLGYSGVLHFQFGPGLACATDGVRVLLLSSFSDGASFALVHRGNVIGPVTSADLSPEDWNYGTNRAVTQFHPTSGALKKTKKSVLQQLISDI